jgi:outer membrane protein assembly factor BamB
MNLTRVLAFLVLAISASTTHAQDGWLFFRGDAQRSGAASNKPAWEKRVGWQRPLLFDKLEGFPDADPDETVDALIKKLRKDADPTILPGSFPLIVDGFCIYRNYRGVCNVALRDFSIKDEESGRVEAFRASDLIWKGVPHEKSLAMMLENGFTKRLMPKLVEMLKASKQEHQLWANPMIGSVSADEKMAYAIDDIPFIDDKDFPNPEGKRFRGNRLYAYHLSCGKIKWDIVTIDNPFFEDVLPEFKESYFVGAPFPVNRKLFLLNEKSGELCLMVLDPSATKVWKSTVVPTLEKSTSLIKIADAERASKNLLRRTQPLHIAQADDLLVCPTHAGVLFGVERGKMKVRWDYRYRAEKTVAPKLPFWQAACPIVTKDRIAFTAADAPDIHCIDFDGKKKWVAEPDGDLYLAAVHEGLVLLVGKTHCRALSLVDGEVKWRIRVGQPAGVGVNDGPLYYLPIKDGKGPAIWEIDIVKGKKVRRLDVPHPDALGNLALHRGMLVSQSVTHIAAFPLGAK